MCKVLLANGIAELSILTGHWVSPWHHESLALRLFFCLWPSIFGKMCWDEVLMDIIYALEPDSLGADTRRLQESLEFRGMWWRLSSTLCKYVQTVYIMAFQKSSEHIRSTSMSSFFSCQNWCIFRAHWITPGVELVEIGSTRHVLVLQEQYWQDTTSNLSTPLHMEAERWIFPLILHFEEPIVLVSQIALPFFFLKVWP